MFSQKPSLFKRILNVVLVIFITMVLGVLSYFLYNLYVAYVERPADIIDEPTISDAEITLESGVKYQVMSMQTKTAFCSNESINFIDINGKKQEEIAISISNPYLDCKNDYLLISDLGSKKAYLFKGNKENTTYKTNGAIITSAVSESGYSVFVIKGELHKCSVVVYDTNGKEIFIWNSGGLDVISADISSDGKEICLSTINTDEGVLKSNIIMFNTGKDKPFLNDTYDGLIFASVLYEGSNIYAVGDSATYIYNDYGRLVGSIDYSERKLVNYSTDNDNIVMAFSNSSYLNGGTLIENYNTDGKQKGSYELLDDVRFLDIKDGNIAVNSGTSLLIMDSKCRGRKNIILGTDINDFMFFGSKKTGLGVSGSGARIIRVE